MDIELEIFNILKTSNIPLHDSQIAKEVHDADPATVKNVLKILMREALVQKAKGDKWRINPKADKMVGKIETKRQGYGFLILPECDYFVSSKDLWGALDGDIVIGKIKRKKRGIREEVRVIKILRRTKKEIIGRFQFENSMPVVAPSDRRIPYLVEIPMSLAGDAQEGQIVVAKVLEYPDKFGAFPRGEIIEILGDEWDENVEIEIMIREHGIKRSFPDEILAEAETVAVPPADTDIRLRDDIRDELLVTIDGEDAKDFDDAVSIKKLKDNGYLLRVAIADVSHYVTPLSKLFHEAEDRGTSIYLVDRVIPMLPPVLSNDICSLKPGEDRLCIAVDIVFSPDAQVKSHKIYAAAMRSHARLTYEAVDDFFETGKSSFGEEIGEMLLVLKEFSQKLEKKRLKRGSLEFETVEPKIIMDNGKPTDIKLIHETASRKLIEESMIAANEAVAEFLKEKAKLSVYRIHQPPDMEVLKQLSAILETLGHRRFPEEPSSKDIQKVIDFARGKPEKLLINTLLLRSMQQARYATSETGHFGLASESYTHFTSPIRRFPDLIVHMLVKQFVGFWDLGEKLYHLYLHLAAICEHSSAMERAAIDAERESVDVKICQYMLGKVGQEFTGIISGLIPYGMFVELENTAEGLVHISDLTDDYYHLNPEKLTLTGARKGKIYRLGEQVKVKLKKVRIGERKLDFKLL